MGSKVLVFFPQVCCPPKSGNHQRCLEIMSGFQEMGDRVYVLSSNYSSQILWKNSNVAALKARGAAGVSIHNPLYWRNYLLSIIDAMSVLFNSLPFKWRLALKKTLAVLSPEGNAEVQPRGSSPAGLKKWFLKIVDDIQPDILLMNYAQWDHLVDHKRYASLIRVIDSHDLVTLDSQYQRAIRKYLPVLPARSEAVDEELLREDFFEKRNFLPAAEEFAIYDQYDYTIAISQREADLIKKNTRRTHVLFLPMTQTPQAIANDYSGPAIFPAGPNVFNIQGYLFFVRKVLPRILKKAPDFLLTVTGKCTSYLCPEKNVALAGFVPDLKSLYENARFLVSPLLGGTGQQVKIVEAMAHGIPVIALKTIREPFPVLHGINGLIAENAEEFSDYAAKLWEDRKFCAQLGTAARQTIAEKFSKTHLFEALKAIKGKA